MKRKSEKCGFVSVFLCVSLLLSPCFAALYQVQDVQFTFGAGTYYQGATQQFVFNQNALTGDLSVLKNLTETDYEYSIHNAAVTISPCGLLSAPGTFAGGVILTVKGQLVDNATNTAYSLAGDTLLTATMNDAVWDISEPFSYYVYGGGTFSPTGGLLYAGLDAGGNTVKVTDFVFGFFAVSTLGGSFGTKDVSAMQSSIQLHSDVVPEPATIALLSIGMVCLTRRQKKTQ